MLVLTTYRRAGVFTSVARLQRLIAQGQVRYAFLNSFCGHASSIERRVLGARDVGARARDRRICEGRSRPWGTAHLLPGASS